MSAEKKKQMGVLGLIVALVLVLFGGVLFVGAASGWFDDIRVTLDTEYVCEDGCDENMIDLDVAGYEELIKAKKSFIVFVDQTGCTTADKLRGFAQDYAKEKGIKMYRMMFEQVKESSLHNAVHYYPSVALVSKGKVVGALQADSDADAPVYNDYEIFVEWINKYLEKK